MAPQAAEATIQQTGAGQREPSMEEILASIRRIIEDSDSARPSEDSAIPTPANTSEPANRRVAGEVATFREELGSDPKPASSSIPTPTRAETVMQPPAPSVAAPLNPVAEQSFAPRTVKAEPALTAETMRKEWHDRLAAPRPETVPAAAAPTAPSPVPAPQAPVQAAPVAEPAQTLVDTHRGSIISEVAGRQVAAAFGELTDAFAATRRRSFDEVAEEMMRPMLQEWMDNNLPTLVERLVREEIERVARGSTR